MPKAYSYVRFSSAKQALGDSLRRQHARARAYAERHGLDLDESLAYQDLGVSAYQGANATTGALSQFLQHVRNGAVPPGSYLLVEQLDRLSRAQPLQAMDVLRAIVEAGVNVVTLADEHVLTAESVKNFSTLIYALVVMSRAHEESVRKSDFSKSNWAQRRVERPAVFTAQCPSWLSPLPDRSGYALLPERSQSVRKVFELTASGYGNVAIARRANAEGWAVPGRATSWHPTLVTKLLRNRAVLGEYQPHTKHEGTRTPLGDPWPAYYPAVVTQDLYDRATAAKVDRAQLPRRRDAAYLNVLQGLLVCSCGASLVRKNKGSTVQPNYAQYLCSGRIRAVTDCPSISQLDLVPALLRAIYRAVPQHVQDDDFTQWARHELTSSQQALADARSQLDGVLVALTRAPDSDALVQHLRSLEALVRERQAHYDERVHWLASLGSAADPVRIEGSVDDALGKLWGDEHLDFRASLHANLARVVRRIEVNTRTRRAAISWRTPDPDLDVQL